MMRQRWRGGLTTMLVVVALVVVLGLIARHLEWEEYTVPVRLRGEAARNPFYAAEHFVRSLGARSEWREVVGELPPTSGVLVLRRWQWNLIPSRRIAIERWVEAGGRLVLYEPRRYDDDEVFRAWSGLSWEYTNTSAESSGADVMDEDGCGQLTVQRDVRSSSDGRVSYRVCSTSANASHLVSRRAPLWSLSDPAGLQAVRVAIGRGSVTWINVPEIFANREFANGDHGLVFVAMTQLRPGDQFTFVFVSDSGPPSLLALIWKHGAAVVILAALALLTFLWRSAVRFGPPAAVPELARRSLVEQIRGTGRFVRRYGKGAALHVAARRALYEVAQRRIPRWSSLPEDQRVLALAGAAGVSAEDIREALQDERRSNHDLNRVLERLEQTRRRLMEKILDAS